MQARFMRLGGKEAVRCKLFVDMSTVEQDSIRKEVDCINETPVIVYIKDEYLIVITNEACYVRTNNVWRKVSYTACRRVDLVSEGEDYLRRLVAKRRGKLDEIILTTDEGREIVLLIDEESRPFNALFQTLHFVRRLNT